MGIRQRIWRLTQPLRIRNKVSTSTHSCSFVLLEILNQSIIYVSLQYLQYGYSNSTILAIALRIVIFAYEINKIVYVINLKYLFIWFHSSWNLSLESIFSLQSKY